ncbi:histidinol-phosphate aminotransferase family protein [Porphyromonadaceae bacterium OttesenSCG-928-L07]|nr:histidinol-phosphate aminotransferase family protein [Porphyromonadaceae bacterium OttesenSCG-928-L07]
MPKRTLADLPKTVHGGVAWKIKGIEDFSHNLNPLGPPGGLKEIISESVSGVDHYPDDSCTELKHTIADHHDINIENVIIGAGSSELIRAFPNAFLGEGESVIIPRPSFAEYTQQCRIVGANIIDNLLLESQDFRLNPDNLSFQLTKNVKAYYICNPNNPTGRIEPREKILDIVEQCEKKNVMVFLDETLLELVPSYRDVSCVEFVKDHPNLFIIGSLTKSYAIPGIRIGFGFGSKEIIETLDKIRLPWNVGYIEQNVATRLIRDHSGHVERAALMMNREAKRMYVQLKDIGFPVLSPTDSFFFFNSLKTMDTKAAVFQDRMIDNRIMVRDCASFGMPFDWYVRFCVKDPERNTAFIQAVHDVLRDLGW